MSICIFQRHSKNIPWIFYDIFLEYWCCDVTSWSSMTNNVKTLHHVILNNLWPKLVKIGPYLDCWKCFWKVDVKNEVFSNSRFEAQLWPKEYLGIKSTIWVLSIRMSNKRIKWLLMETFNIMSESYFQRLQLFLWEFLNQNGNFQDSKAWESWNFDGVYIVNHKVYCSKKNGDYL
jgi:hypothetical protein